MSDPNAKKILIAGDVRGNVQALYKRVASVNASAAGPFHALFCVGPFFAEASDGDAAAGSGDAAMDELRPYIDGTAVAPLPTYFVDALPAGRDLCRHPEGVVAPDITFLRSPGVRVVEGLRVASLPGHYNPMSFDDESKLAATAAAAEGEYTKQDVKALRTSLAAQGGGGVDLLLTSDWPRNVTAFSRDGKDSASAASRASAAGSPASAELARELQPRYHVSGRSGGAFYAREPYRNAGHAGHAGHATRFVGLGAVGNKEKTKWLHALALAPAETMPPSALALHPADTTASPYALPVPPPPPRGGANGAPGGGDGKRPFPGVDASEFDHSALRWEDPRAKRARAAAAVDRRPLRGDVDKTVYVRNLNFRADEGAIGEFFGQCGALVDLRLGRDDQGRSRGYCHVSFKTAEAAAKALELTDSSFFGRDITVAMAKSEEQRNAERDERRGNDRRRNRADGAPPTGCWFCLSNEKDTHLVASIARESFVSMDKGGLVPDHCQVVPVEHAPSFAAMPVSAAEEVWLYIQSVRKCLAAGGGGAPLENREPRDLVVFERHLSLRSKGGNHCHMNCVPVPRERAKKARKIFEQAAKRLNFEWTELSPKPASALDLQTAIAEIAGDGEYYAVHLPDGAVLMRCIRPKEPHWMSFGREVLGHLLGCPERTSWQECMESEAAETARAEKFKASFEAHDAPARIAAEAE